MRWWLWALSDIEVNSGNINEFILFYLKHIGLQSLTRSGFELVFMPDSTNGSISGFNYQSKSNLDFKPNVFHVRERMKNRELKTHLQTYSCPERTQILSEQRPSRPIQRILKYELYWNWIRIHNQTV